jgi:hypothetical protein
VRWRGEGFERSQGETGTGKREDGAEVRSWRKDMIGRKERIQRLEECMGEGCQSCVVERANPALHLGCRQ